MNGNITPPSPLFALSPLDGRYAEKASSLRLIASEYGLIRLRCKVELQWLMHLCDQKALPCTLNETERSTLTAWAEAFSPKEAEHVKSLEATTNHDVKAVEYALQALLKNTLKREDLIPWLHFGCTSEDINNLAYALMLQEARDDVILPQQQRVHERLYAHAMLYKAQAMMARTHGQAASPTTLGKELINSLDRLQRAKQALHAVPITGKCNGATGNFNAHTAAYPDVDWPALSHDFVTSLGLSPLTLTTQIEPHDHLAAFLHALMRYNTVLLDAARDAWTYISLGYFQQKTRDNEVGSSTMPHKVNPIDFENAEGNLGVANSLAAHMASKLPVSRLQRDLSDSTVLRNLGCVLGYSDIAYQAFIKGLSKLEAHPERMHDDLDAHWALLTEAVQTVMRAHGMPDAYEQLKQLSRGKAVDRMSLQRFMEGLTLPDAQKKQLLRLTPQHYVGLAEALCEGFVLEA